MGTQAIRTTPSSPARAARTLALASVTAASMAVAALSAALPSAVKAKSPPPRTISTAPNAASAAASLRLTVEPSTPSIRAAPATDPASPSARRTRKSLQFGSAMTSPASMRAGRA